MRILATVVSVHAGSNLDPSMEVRPSIRAELDRIAGDQVTVETCEAPDWMRRSPGK